MDGLIITELYCTTTISIVYFHEKNSNESTTQNKFNVYFNLNIFYIPYRSEAHRILFITRYEKSEFRNNHLQVGITLYVKKTLIKLLVMQIDILCVSNITLYLSLL